MIDASNLVPVYPFQDIVLSHGEGCILYDTTGKSYLDFASGVATTCLGHAHPELVKAISDQAGKLMHVPGSYHNVWRLKLAEQLVSKSCFDQAMFSNSGAEANEAALKLARKWSKEQKGEQAIEVVCFEKAFHGRTMGTASYSGNLDRYKVFAPFMEGPKLAKYNDISSVQITDKTAAIIIEPVQGEGGVNPATPEFLKGLRDLADQHHVPLIFDEVQSGVGRLGTLFAYQSFGVEPDIISMAKGLGGGYPIGATLAKSKFASAFKPGDHGTTQGGNPLACCVASTVLDVFENEAVLDNVIERGDQLHQGLLNIKDKLGDRVVDVRGMGLLRAIELSGPVDDIFRHLLQEGLMVLKAGANILRFAPPLIISEEEVSQALAQIEDAIS